MSRTNQYSLEDILDDQNTIDDMLARLRHFDYLPGRLVKSPNLSACIPALVVALSIQTDIKQLTQVLPYQKGAISEVDVLNVLARLGFVGRSCRISLQDIDPRLTPCLFVVKDARDNMEHAWVIMGEQHLQYGDPVDANSEMNTCPALVIFDSESERCRELERPDLIGTAYFFATKQTVETPLHEHVRKASGFSWTRALLERFRPVLLHIFAQGIMINMVALAVPLFVMMTYDRVISGHSPNVLVPLLIGALVGLSIEYILRNLRARTLAWLGTRIDTLVSVNIFEQLLSMPLILTERASISAQISRIKAFECIKDLLGGPLFIALIESPFILVLIGVIGLLSGQLVIIPAVAALLFLALILYARSSIKTSIKLAANANAEKQQRIFETFNKMHGLRSCAVADVWLEQFRKLSGEASMAGFNACRWTNILETVSQAILSLTGVLVIAMGIDAVIRAHMSVGALIACTILVWRVLSPFQTLCNALPRYLQVQNAVEQVNRLMDIETETARDKNQSKLVELRGHIAFNKVGLRYSSQLDPVFAGLSFEAMPGEMIAITGVNGAGKTTILNLIKGFYRPQAGAIRIDGIDIRQLDPSALRQNIAYASQSPHLFYGTIAQNLRIADPLAEDNHLMEGLRQVGALEEVMAFAKGLNTIINPASEKIPNSLLYKLNLARAYLQNSAIMLFDELPYSILNSKTGELFKQQLVQWRGARTVLFITHRRDYIELADKVIYLRSNEVPVVGPTKDVINFMDEGGARHARGVG